MEARRDVFQAIADPTRRAILGILAVQTLTLNAIAENFETSRPAISKHIKILSECGLIEIKQEGRERFCEAKLEKLNEVICSVSDDGSQNIDDMVEKMMVEKMMIGEDMLY